MSTIGKSPGTALAALALPRSGRALAVYAQNVVKRMTGNPSFPTATPLLAAITTAVVELQAAETAALNRTKGAITVRDDKRTALVVLLRQLRAAIQTAADADPTNGAAIIESAGVPVRKTLTRRPRVFAAKPGPVSGVATLVTATAGPRASYEWQYSTDACKTWVTAPVTLRSRTTIAGLLPGATVLFKSRAVTKTGESDWTQPVSLVVQ